MEVHTYNEVVFLRYFYEVAKDAMGPASDDIYQMIKEDYIKTHKVLPEGYGLEEEEEE